MKISRRLVTFAGIAAAIALPVASQAQVTYYTTGVFSSSGTNAVSNNGMTITFNGLGSTVADPTPSGISFGNFVTSGAPAGGTPSFGGGFTLNIFQTAPTGGSGTFAGAVAGNLFSTGSRTYWTPSGPLTFDAGASTYQLFTQSSTPAGPGYTIVAPNNNGGVTSLQGYVSTPEPSSMALLGTGLIGLVPMIRRKKQK